MLKRQPKIYFGDGGFRGMSEIRRSGSMNSRPSIRKSPSVYMGGEMSVGVSTRTVLASGGIARGEVVRVKVEEKPIVKPKPVVAAITSPKVEKELDESMSPKDERGKVCGGKMSETEERLADFLGAAQEAKAKCEGTVEPTSMGVLPELPLREAVPVEGKRKRKQRRKQQKEAEGLNLQ